MLPEIGHFALINALLVAITLGVLPLVGAQRGIAAWMALARPAALALFGLVGVSFLCLMGSFVANDFSVYNVANNSNSQLPLQYRIAATWGSHEGSMLLWVFMLAGWSAAVALFSRNLPADLVARVLAVMGLVTIGFILFILLTSNPFTRLVPAALDGRDLNPLLQDPGMVIHPPMLYMGYVGFSVAFAFAIAGLLGGRFDAAWARWSRPWTTAAWAFLTVGIALGSWWAYYELGWGGWWFWDPVENASFMPWIVGTALIHSLAVAEKRGAFKAWTVLLAIAAFSLSLLGTFLVRSGVLTSVHAFATDPSRGIFILGFIVLVVGGSLTLFAWRASQIGMGGRFDKLSRESLLLANNALLVAATGAVMLGTLYPLAIDALGLGKLSVGPPFFEAVFAPLMAPVVLLMGVGPLARWKSAGWGELAQRLKWAALLAAAFMVAVPLLAGRFSVWMAMGLFLGAWVFTSTAALLALRMRAQPGAGLGERLAPLRRSSRSFYGMVLAHLGVGVFIIGVTLVKGFETEKDVKMQFGERVVVGGHEFVFDHVADVQGPNFRALRGQFTVRKEGAAPGPADFIMHPEKRIYRVQTMPMTEAAIDSGVTRDLYVSLGEMIDPRTFTVRVYYKPFVNWIWGGCGLMALGGLLALADRRYRVKAKQAQADLQAAPARPGPAPRQEARA